MDLEQRNNLSALLDAGLPEFRSVPFSDFESEDDGWGFRGLAAVYGEEADLGDFTEEFQRGAFRKPLANGDNTRLIYEHAPPHMPVLATIGGGTLTVKDDVKGLDVRGRIAQHYVGEAARELIRRGDITGMSPGMIVGAGNSEISWRANGRMHRAIRALKHLPELSLTSDPVYAGTTAEMRSMWAFKMAESLGPSQHALLGAYPQLESRAQAEAVDTDDEAVAAAVEAEKDPSTCEKCGVALEEGAEHACNEDEEQRSGATAMAAAARRRRLHMMGLTLPRDPVA